MKELLTIISVMLFVLSAGCLIPPEGKACTTEYVPVCGEDGKTYSNTCFAEIANVSVAHMGECNASIANPASEFCIRQGGKVEIETDASGGQLGVCVLPTGQKCEEWAYYRGECPAKNCSGTCPQYAPPAPGWCSDGTVVERGVDECGCQLPPTCERLAKRMTRELCESAGGHFNECASACRNNPDAEVCILVCVQECECGGIAGFKCPAGYYCTDYVPKGSPNAIGVCRPI